ncbi:MAG: hypothetical protein M0Z72_03775 [Deltaproteobacteria bacterium]|nr:hypothetical protein [Deltaproteobacteria bacterium]
MGKQKSKSRLKPLSLYPLPPEGSLRLFIQVKPEKIEAEKKKLKEDKGRWGAYFTTSEFTQNILHYLFKWLLKFYIK